ncbi:MAG TPA: SCP2 sterol-binding domain-containing protein [Acidimicrobiales bacterium]|nr:SCP2 sterol-binding domain-containing protein [Acidimicrobiales bacterium]
MTSLTYVVGADKHVVEAPGDGELTVIVEPRVYEQLLAGALRVDVAYMQGKVKITGDQAALYDLLPDIPLPG